MPVFFSSYVFTSSALLYPTTLLVFNAPFTHDFCLFKLDKLTHFKTDMKIFPDQINFASLCCAVKIKDSFTVTKIHENNIRPVPLHHCQSTDMALP